MHIGQPAGERAANTITQRFRVEIDESNAYIGCDWHGGAVMTENGEVHPFGAKEVRKPSSRGLNRGRIVFLTVGMVDDAIEFDRGWKRKPQTAEGRAVLAAILARLS